MLNLIKSFYFPKIWAKIRHYVKFLVQYIDFLRFRTLINFKFAIFQSCCIFYLLYFEKLYGNSTFYSKKLKTSHSSRDITWYHLSSRELMWTHVSSRELQHSSHRSRYCIVTSNNLYDRTKSRLLISTFI